MRNISRVCAMLLVFAAAGLTLAAGHKMIKGSELEGMMNDGSPLVIVDVREPELYKEGHIPGAINIPYDGAHERVLKELKPSDRIVFVCHGGPMGDELAGILVENGYLSVHNLKGGMRWWSGDLVR